MTIQSAKEKIKALLEKRGFVVQSMKEGLFTIDTGVSKVGVELFGDRPVVGVFINNKLEEEGHGIEAVFSLRSQVLAVWDREINRGVSEQPAPKPEPEKHMTTGKDIDERMREKDRLLENAKLAQKIHDEELKAQPKPAEVVNVPKRSLTEELEPTKDYKGDVGWEKPPEKPIHKPDAKGEMKNMEQKSLAVKEPESLSIDVIRQYICPEATEIEAYNFLQLCLRRDLNPFLKEAYLIKYGSQPATMVVGKDAFTRKAEESGKLDGYEAGIIVLNKEKQVERRIGVVQYEGDVLVGGWAKVFRKDMKYPFVCEVPLTEYIKKKDGKPMSSWAIMPGTMIRKVALVQALREGFTRELGGCYDAAELQGTEIKETKSEEK